MHVSFEEEAEQHRQSPNLVDMTLSLPIISQRDVRSCLAHDRPCVCSHGAADAHTLVVPSVTVVGAEPDQQGNHHAHVRMHVRLRRPDGAVSFGVVLIQNESNDADQAKAQRLEQHTREHTAVYSAENVQRGAVVVPVASGARTHARVGDRRAWAGARSSDQQYTHAMPARVADASVPRGILYEPAPIFNHARASASSSEIPLPVAHSRATENEIYVLRAVGVRTYPVRR
eukprot:COSAG02_NODE_5835_length_4002_cov_2.424289_2_plen_230_part_00